MASSLSLSMDPKLKYSSNFRCIMGTNSREWALPGQGNPGVFIRERVKGLALRQEALQLEIHTNRKPKMNLTNANFEEVLGTDLLTAAYDRCREQFLVKYDPFHFGSLLLNPQKQKGVWAIWAWGRRVDEMVDGVNGSFATHEILDRMEESVAEIYQGRPRDIYDVALADTVSRYPVDFLLFKDVIDGTRWDLAYKRFENIEEHNLYWYLISSAFFLMLIQVMGIAPESSLTIEKIYNYMVTLGIGFAFVDMLRDIAEDAKMGRIYFSPDELRVAGVSEDDILKGRVTENWKNFMRQQIKQARMYLDEGARGINELNADVRWSLWTFVLVYKQDLEVIEANDYDCFSKRSKAGKARSIASLPLAFAKSLGF